jgi:isopenicillin N synthase-like dioxygenase
VVNIGLALQRWTCNRLIATNHRVLFTRVERLSIPFFLEPTFNTELRPFDGLSVEQHNDCESYQTYGQFLLAAMTRFKEYQRDSTTDIANT